MVEKNKNKIKFQISTFRNAATEQNRTKLTTLITSPWTMAAAS